MPRCGSVRINAGDGATTALSGRESKSLPPGFSNWNAYADRFIWTFKESCLDRMILMGESSLHRAALQFVQHFHAERNHQGLEKKIIQPEFAVFPSQDDVCCRKGLGWLLRYYYPEAT
jgi:hypothetical protein